MRRREELDRFRSPLSGERKTDVRNRLRSARGHLDHVLQSLESEDTYVIDVLQQLAAVRGSIDATVRIALRYYVENAIVPGLRGGETDAAIEELMTALSFLRSLG